VGLRTTADVGRLHLVVDPHDRRRVGGDGPLGDQVRAVLPGIEVRFDGQGPSLEDLDDLPADEYRSVSGRVETRRALALVAVRGVDRRERPVVVAFTVVGEPDRGRVPLQVQRRPGGGDSGLGPGLPVDFVPVDPVVSAAGFAVPHSDALDVVPVVPRRELGSQAREPDFAGRPPEFGTALYQRVGPVGELVVR